MALLEVERLTKLFGGLRAVDGFDVGIEQGELVGLIGPNGAGKTTVFNLLTGLLDATSGEASFMGHRLLGRKASDITRLGLARTFQNIRLFSNLSVLDNVRIALHTGARYGLAEAFLRIGRYGSEEHRIRERAMELLKIMGLTQRASDLARNLPYGEQRRVEIARALAVSPRLLLLDEPAAGMNPQETMELLKLIRWLRDSLGITVFLIEHDMNLVMNLCERILVLDYGVTIAHGTPEEIRRNPRVIEAYLGEEAKAS